MPTPRHRRARSMSPAPLCWAVTAAMAEAKAVVGSMLNTMSFSATPTEAEATSPMWLMRAVMTRKEALTSPSWTAMGSPDDSISRAATAWNLGLPRRYLARWPLASR